MMNRVFSCDVTAATLRYKLPWEIDSVFVQIVVIVLYLQLSNMATVKTPYRVLKTLYSIK